MADAGRHPNITILTNTELESVEGEPGNFTVIVERKPRYVDEELCVGCRTCTAYCPCPSPNPFDENLSHVKAIDIWCLQGVPSIAHVSRDACLYFQNKCTICIPVCKAKAIDFSQKRKRGRMHVGAIILTPGYDIFNAKTLGEYGYGRMKNVMNSLEFERLLNSGGPYKGEVLRPSNKKIPQKIAWLQCVGSRDMRFSHTYCSGVCCTYAIKQAMVLKTHHPGTQVKIFHNDIRTFGKGFEELYGRVQQLEGVDFVRRRIAVIKENKKNNNLIIHYISENNTIQEEEFEMVVLSVGLTPTQSIKSVSEIIGIKLNRHGFCETDFCSPNEIANHPGIFSAATFTGPMDIPDSISSAAGAASKAAQLLFSQRGTLAKVKKYPEEKSVAGDEVKIGVFVCHCGTNIAGVADVNSLIQHASKLKSVVHCEDQMISCASDSLQKIKKVIQEKGLNRVVVAACTPRGHEPLFRDIIREAGLNQYLLEIANIREHCTWVHSQNKEAATQKANDLIAMAVAKARLLSPLQEIELPVNPRGLILGGGLAGMKAALSSARQGFEVYLVEKENELGGNLKNLYYTLEAIDVKSFLEKLIDEVECYSSIKVFKGYQLKSLSGFVGNFKSTLMKVLPGDGRGVFHSLPITLEHGIIIVATGGKLLKPTEYCYGKSNKIVTQQEFEKIIATHSLPKSVRQIVMIQCVGIRNEERPSCSRICCGEAIKNALKVKERYDDIEIIVFYRDIRTYGFKEDYYTQARENGVLFIRYQPEKRPVLDIRDGDTFVTFYDLTLNRQGKLQPDLVVLSTPVTGEENKELSRLLHVPVSADGFFMEAHMKLRPLDFSTEGIFLCGMASYPKDISETISQAEGAAIRAATILCKHTIKCSGAICEVDVSKCIACGGCVKACPYGAINLQEVSEGVKGATVIPALCKGCGTCNPKCPTGAITLNHFRDSQIFSQIAALGAC